MYEAREAIIDRPKFILELAPDMDDLQAREADFLGKVKTLTPSLTELADIEEQVLRDPDMTGVKPGDTLPGPDVERDYTTDERQVVRRFMRAKIAEQNMPLLFSPIMPSDLQDQAAKAQLEYVKGRISSDTFARRISDYIPYFVATLAARGEIESGDDGSRYPRSVPPASEFIEYAQGNSETVGEWFRYGTQRRPYIEQSMYWNDPTLNVKPLDIKHPWFATIDHQLETSKVVADTLARYIHDPDALRRHNDHNARMKEVIEGTKFRFFPQDESPTFDYFNSWGNWLSRMDPEARLLERAPRDIEGRDFKLHLMPFPEDIPLVTKQLLDMFSGNPELGKTVRGFKVSNDMATERQTQEHPSPVIVIYPYEDTESIATLLAALGKEFKTRQGLNIVPRFNIPVDGSSILYMAEGQGHDKAELYEYDETSLARSYDKSQNYAFRAGDEEIVSRIMARAAELMSPDDTAKVKSIGGRAVANS